MPRLRIIAGVIALVVLVGASIMLYQNRNLLDVSSGSASSGSSAGLSMTQCDSSICARNGSASVPLTSFNGYGSPCHTSDYFRFIGDYTNDGSEEAYFLYCDQSGGRTLFIVDFATQTILGKSTVALTHSALAAFVASAKDPEGRYHPYIANGYGDTGTWGYLCVFRPDVVNKFSDDTCGTGFVRIWTKPTLHPVSPDIFREVGTYNQDLDRDGWEDIHVIYHWGIVTVSPKKLSLISQIQYNVSSADEPSSPAGFHSGRNYGLHTSFQYNNTDYNLIIGGTGVETYHREASRGVSDPMCNVSRFVALLGGDATTRSLRWSDYYGFHSNILSSEGAVLRNGDFQNGCIHYFNQQVFDIAGKKVIAYNVFSESAPINQCLEEQKLFYTGASGAWDACYPQNMESAGRWTLVFKDLLTGTDVARIPNYYVIGSSGQILSSKPRSFIALKLPSSSKYPFNLDSVPLKKYVAFALTDTFQIESEIDVPSDAIPTIGREPARDASGYGSLNNALTTLILPPGKYPLGAIATVPAAKKNGDIDGDGDVDVTDYSALVAKFGQTSNLGVFDILPDGKVDIFDYNALVLNIGK